MAAPLSASLARLLYLVGSRPQSRKTLSAFRISATTVKTNIRHASTVVPSPDTLILNDNCVKQVHKVCTDGSKLRIAVEGGGCSGFQYKFSLVEPNQELAADDICISYKGANVVIDEESLEFVRGSVVDYNTELIRSAFRIIDNPHAEQGCSCGASFAIKE